MNGSIEARAGSCRQKLGSAAGFRATGFGDREEGAGSGDPVSPEPVLPYGPVCAGGIQM